MENGGKKRAVSWQRTLNQSKREGANFDVNFSYVDNLLVAANSCLQKTLFSKMDIFPF